MALDKSLNIYSIVFISHQAEVPTFEITTNVVATAGAISSAGNPRTLDTALATNVIIVPFPASVADFLSSSYLSSPQINFLISFNTALKYWFLLLLGVFGIYSGITFLIV